MVLWLELEVLLVGLSSCSRRWCCLGGYRTFRRAALQIRVMQSLGHIQSLSNSWSNETWTNTQQTPATKDWATTVMLPALLDWSLSNCESRQASPTLSFFCQVPCQNDKKETNNMGTESQIKVIIERLFSIMGILNYWDIKNCYLF